MPVTIRPISYVDYRRNCVTGDILLCRPASPEGRIIVEFTRDGYSHASMAGWINECRRDDPSSSVLMLAESVQHKGKRIIPLSDEIGRFPGRYDVFRVKEIYPRLENTGYDGKHAWAWMCRASGSQYGWIDISRVALRRYLHLFFVPPVPNSDLPGFGRDCSAQVHAALRAAGGPQLRQYDSDVAPGDLANPKWFEYQGTLYQTKDQAAAVQDVLDARAALAAAEADARENGVEDSDDAA